MTLQRHCYLSIVGDNVSLRYHFGKDASQTPDVNGSGVVLATQQDFRRPVPKRDHLENITDTSVISERNNHQKKKRKTIMLRLIDQSQLEVPLGSRYEGD